MNFVDPNAAISRRASVCHYLVVQIGADWWVDVEGKPFGPWLSKDNAVSAAQNLIRTFGDDARPADIWAPDGGGKPARVWHSVS